MRNRVILSLALAFLVAPLAFAGQDAKATNAADGCFQVTELALAQSQPQVVQVNNGVGQCVSECERRRQARFQRCVLRGIDANRCASLANRRAQRCKAVCRADDNGPV